MHGSSCLRSGLLAAPLFIVLLGPSGVADGASPSAAEILRQTQDTYDSLRSYSSAGEVTSNFSSTGLEAQQSTHTFTMVLARPELYGIEWEQHLPNVLMKGAAWSVGDFFGLGQSLLKALTGANLGKEETIESDRCYVLSGRVANMNTTLWISKTSKLVRQVRHDFGGPMEMPEMTDDDVRKALESMNREATDEAVEAMKAQLEAAKKMMSQNMTGFSIEIHRDIRVNRPLTEADFSSTVEVKGK